MRDSGFTLIELLLVIAIMGILLALFGDSLLRGIRTAELREAATGFTADLRGARAQAQRKSTDQVISWTAGSKVTSYSVNGSVRTLPGGISFTCVAGCDATVNGNTATYLSPYGELSTLGGAATGKILRISSPLASIRPFDIRVAGVTGNVLLTAWTP